MCQYVRDQVIVTSVCCNSGSNQMQVVLQELQKHCHIILVFCQHRLSNFVLNGLDKSCVVPVNVVAHSMEEERAIHTVFRINPAIQYCQKLIGHGVGKDDAKETGMIGICPLRVT